VAELIARWYALLASLSQAAGEPISMLVGADIGPLAAILLGLLGALSPCQLSTGLGAVALIGRPVPGRRPLVAGASYVAGKALVYAALGLAVVMLGQSLATMSIPLIVVVRRALGPLMLLAGLVVLGVLRPRVMFGAGEDLASAVADRLDATRPRAAFLLGAAFAFAFCPTLFLLFFGVLIPLALTSPIGITYPALFAVGTTLPLLVVFVVLALRPALDASWAGRSNRVLSKIAGVVLLIAGLNDTVVYWIV